MKSYEFRKNIISTVSYNVDKYSKLKKITLEELAKSVGISLKSLENFISSSGKSGMSLINIYKISIVLGVTMDDLVEEKEPF